MSMFTEEGQITEFHLVNVSTVRVESIHNICILIKMIHNKNHKYFIDFVTPIFPSSSEFTFPAISLSLKIHFVAYVLSAFGVIW